MANNRIEFQGLEEMRRLLRQLPQELAEEGAGIVNAAARAAFQEIYERYPIGPGTKKRQGGTLRRGLSLSVGDARKGESVGKGVQFGAYAVIKNRAKHAWIFENGTQVRRVAAKVAGRAGNFGTDRGSMTPGRVFIPAVIRHRRAMNAQLRLLLEQHGFQVR